MKEDIYFRVNCFYYYALSNSLYLIFICSHMSLKLQIKYFIYELSSKHDLHRSLLGLVIPPYSQLYTF